MSFGRWMILIGLGLVAAGLLAMLGAKLGLPRLGRLPGDIVYRGKSGVFYFPITTCILASILLTLLMTIYQRFR